MQYANQRQLLFIQCRASQGSGRSRFPRGPFDQWLGAGSTLRPGGKKIEFHANCPAVVLILIGKISTSTLLLSQLFLLMLR
jgi:hypothetical protein